MQLVTNAVCKAVSPEGLRYVRRRLFLKLNPTATATELPTQGCLGVEAPSGLASLRERKGEKRAWYLLHG